MSRLARMAAAAMVLAGALFTSQLTVPSLTLACSCAIRGNIAVVAGDPDVLVLTGTIAAIEINGQQGAQLTVLRVFQGDVRFGPVPIRGGDGANCVPTLENGWHVVLTAHVVETGLEPLACGHFGLLTTPEGQALLREIEVAFGQGAGPHPATADDGTLASIALVAVGGLVAVVLLGAVALAWGRRERGST